MGGLTTNVPCLQHDIGGDKVAGPSAELITDAPDGAPLYEIPMAHAAVIDDAVAVARIGLRRWRDSLVHERVSVLLRAADLLDEQAAAYATGVVRETGKPLADAEDEIHSAARVLRNFAQEAGNLPARVLRNHSSRVWGMEIAEPIGVAAVITTWNLPVQLTALKVGAALIAGCSIVVKPSPLASASVGMLIDTLRRAGLPASVASVVHGGRSTAELLASHPDVAVVSLTGSTTAGQDVMRAAASGPRRCILELGGKSANIVFDDADLDAALTGLVAGFVRNQGAVCTAGSRILVQDRIYGEMLDRLLIALDAVRVGDPYTSVDIGAIRSREHFDFVSREVDDAIAGGATLLAGGGAVDVPGRTGAFMRPALLGNVKPSDRIWQTELFGPVAVITPFGDDEEAVALADGSNYGLAAGLWSVDHARLERAWRSLDVGTVYINSYHRIDGIPLAASGRRSSGYGSEGGISGIREFLASKSVHYPFQ